MNSKLISRQGFTENLCSVEVRCFIKFIREVLPEPTGPESKIPLLRFMPY